MASVLPYRPSTSGSITTSNRRPSLSSFPSSRNTSNPSTHNGMPSAAPPIPNRPGSKSSSRTPSTPSSTQPAARRADASRRTGRLKSQYPADSTERHVEYILVASFHVDRGPIMEHQYPGAISGDENMLAELMLPDQAHMRNEDWTIFFLHKDTSEDDEKAELAAERKEQRRKKREASGTTSAEESQGSTENEEESNTDTDAEKDHDEVEGGEGPPLIYVLNLVNTKQDTTAKRFQPLHPLCCKHCI